MKRKLLLIVCIVTALTLVGTAVACTNATSEPKTEYLYVNTDNPPLDATSATYADVYNAVSETVVQIQATSQSAGVTSVSAGSGVIIQSEGIIVTNHHVISGANEVVAILSDGTQKEAQVIGSDQKSDLAVLRIEASGLPYAVFGSSSSLQVGQQVLAIGNPLGTLGGSASEGIISAKERTIEVEGIRMELLQTTAAINKGNSGGGLFDMSGRLIGIVNAKSSGTGIEGIGFAIPSDLAMPVIESLLEQGYVSGRPSLGVTVQFTRYTPMTVLPLVVAVNQSQTSGLQVGDYIESIDGNTFSDASSLQGYLLSEYEAGDTCTVTVLRNDQRQTLQVTLIDAHENA